MFDTGADQMIAWQLLQGVDVRDRKKGFRTFKDVFIGSQAIDFMVANQHISREEAVKYGQEFLREGLFEYVGNGKPIFADGGRFYRFTLEAKRMYQLNIWGQSQASLQEGQTRALSSQSSLQHSSTNMSESSSIADLKILFCQGVKLADRKHRFKTYTQSFVGSEAVDFLCASQNQSRQEALLLGQKIMDEGTFYHVTHDHHFEDAPLLYRLTDSVRAEPPGNSAAGGRPRPNKMSSFRSPGHHQHHRRCAAVHSGVALELERRVPLENRTHHSVVYKNCFIGSEAVNTMMKFKSNLDRSDAVALGQTIMDDSVFKAVDGKANFEDDPQRFYCFFDRENRQRTVSSRRLKNAFGTISGSFRQRNQNSPLSPVNQSSTLLPVEKCTDQKPVPTRISLTMPTKNQNEDSSDDSSWESSSDDKGDEDDVSIHLSRESDVASSISSIHTFETPVAMMEQQSEAFEPPPLIKPESLTATRVQVPMNRKQSVSRSVDLKINEVAERHGKQKKEGRRIKQEGRNDVGGDEEDSFDRKIALQQHLNKGSNRLPEITERKPSEEVDTDTLPPFIQGVPSVVSLQPSVCETNVSRLTDLSDRETVLHLQHMTEKLEKLTAQVQRSRMRLKGSRNHGDTKQGNPIIQTNSEASSCRETAILEEAILELQKKIDTLVREQSGYKSLIKKLSKNKLDTPKESDTKQAKVIESKEDNNTGSNEE